ncbi:hypothetical protein [Furfurilactobacillus curtus]|uniref:Uncharacterized protein n=1 Tax=Furfurilactobacillus curtus TaxID=1746200 RepID=A0ABQ5JS20_9LACO
MIQLSEKQWAAVVNLEPSYLRARSILNNDWQAIVLDNPLFVSYITVADLQFASQLAAAKVVEQPTNQLVSFAQRQVVRRRLAPFLSSEAKTWLNREDG